MAMATAITTRLRTTKKITKYFVLNSNNCIRKFNVSYAIIWHGIFTNRNNRHTVGELSIAICKTTIESTTKVTNSYFSVALSSWKEEAVKHVIKCNKMRQLSNRFTHFQKANEYTHISMCTFQVNESHLLIVLHSSDLKSSEICAHHKAYVCYIEKCLVLATHSNCGGTIFRKSSNENAKFVTSVK